MYLTEEAYIFNLNIFSCFFAVMLFAAEKRIPRKDTMVPDRRMKELDSLYFLIFLDIFNFELMRCNGNFLFLFHFGITSIWFQIQKCVVFILFRGIFFIYSGIARWKRFHSFVREEGYGFFLLWILFTFILSVAICCI